MKTYKKGKALEGAGKNTTQMTKGGFQPAKKKTGALS